MKSQTRRGQLVFGQHQSALPSSHVSIGAGRRWNPTCKGHLWRGSCETDEEMTARGWN